MKEKAFDEIIEIIKKNQLNKDEIHKLKIKICKKYSLKKVPSDIDILTHSKNKSLEAILRIKPTRTLSGVAVIAVMTSPHDCPHGKCIYCPGGVEHGSAQSYTGREPASLRAGLNNFDPFDQTIQRLKQLNTIGHNTDKIDMIIMGGTFTARKIDYQNWFLKRCFDVLNTKEATTLKEAHLFNENAKNRCIGLTIETRPDWCKKEHVDRILKQGGTRVELGVQTTFDRVLQRIERGHTLKDTINATKILKDTGLKICYHMMPGLLSSTKEMDLESFKEIFSNPNFKPDMLKIYPTLVIKGTKLHELWMNKRYTPMRTEDAVKLIQKVKKIIPKWVRIQRIQRDIPSQLIEDGVKKSNLRQIVKDGFDDCNCIRCREIGLKKIDKIDEDKIKLNRIDYKASSGTEIFLSFEEIENNVLIGYLRLRFPSNDAHRKEIKNASIIREIKVFGISIPIGENPDIGWQHKGYGKSLILEAEKIAIKEGMKKMIVMSGVGARNYFRRFEYERDGVYMGKML